MAGRTFRDLGVVIVGPGLGSICPGGFRAYVQECEKVVANDYEGFAFA